MKNQLHVLLGRLQSDDRLKAYHLVLYSALVFHYLNEEEPICFNISRSRFMRTCWIQSIKTYHKYMQKFVAYGYIEYIPSSHHLKGTEIRLLQLNNQL